MYIKIDTKEKFHVLTPETSTFTDIIAQELQNNTAKIVASDNKNIVLNMRNILSGDKDSFLALADVHTNVYENDASFVICELNDEVKKILDEVELLDGLNITPTESEAWDIVQMEEIEREFLRE